MSLRYDGVWKQMEHVLFVYSLNSKNGGTCMVPEKHKLNVYPGSVHEEERGMGVLIANHGRASF
jgi:hypothetical protein